MTGLEALAHTVPQEGRGVTPVEVVVFLADLGVTIEPGRLEMLLDYLLRGGMVTRSRGRYRQVRSTGLRNESI